MKDKHKHSIGMDPLQILLVEDNPGDARLMQFTISETHNNSFEIEHVERLSYAIEKVNTKAYAAILLDLSLPDTFGLETVKRMCSAAPEVPIVVLTGNDDAALAIQSVQLGAQDYLIKGEVTGNILSRAIHYAMERKRIIDALNHRDAVLEAVSFTAQELIRSEDWRQVIESILVRLGQASQTDRLNLFMFKNTHEGVLATLEHEWCAPQIAPKENPEEFVEINLSVDDFPDLAERLIEAGAVYGPLERFPASVQALLSHNHTRSILIVPIRVSGSLLGTLAFEDSTQVRDWSLPEVDAIKTAVSILGSTIQRQKSEADIRFLANHDSLTRLPNRELFHDRAEHARRRAGRNSGQMAIMLLDLDNFKAINDTYGHPTGDGVLKALAEHLSSTMRKSDTVARMGGDEFTVVLEDIQGKQDCVTVAEKILAIISKELIIDGTSFFLSTSIGISVFPYDGEDVDELLQKADIAMYQAKAEGNQFKFYSPNQLRGYTPPEKIPADNRDRRPQDTEGLT